MKTKIFLTILLFASLLSACKNEKPIANRVQSVKAFKVVCNDAKQTDKMFVGVVKEAREAKLAFQVAGSLVEMNVVAGQYVKKGDLIAKLDQRNYKIQLQAAQAAFENAKVQAERYTALYQKKSTSKSVYDQAQTAYKMYKAKKEAAESAMDDTYLYAPFSGYIQHKLVENYEKVGAGYPIVTLLDVNKLELTVALSETDYLLSNQFKTYSCKINGIDKVFNLDFIDMQRKPNFNGFYVMRLAINADGTRIVPGMAARVTIGVCNDKVCKYVVPVEAVYTKNGKTYVWVIDKNNVVHQTAVEVGNLQSQGKVGINKGLKNNAVVVAAGVSSITDGMEVKILQQPSSTNVGGQL